MTVAFAPDKELKGNTFLSNGTATLKVGSKDKIFAVQCDFVDMSDRWVAVVRPFTVDVGIVEIDNKNSHVVLQFFLAAIALK